MNLFRGTIRPPAILSDQAVERYLHAVREELGPDPLFRRRLRGEVTNRFVAVREGIGTAPQHRSMGKLGRAVLYASFTLALSTTSVLAASQEALPGDLLYPLKRQVESLRADVLPAHLRHDLAAYELAERIDELARLTELGESVRAVALAAEVAEDYEAFVAEADAAGLVSDDRYLVVLTGLLDRLPETAHDAVQAVIDRAPSSEGGSPAGQGSGASQSGTSKDGTTGSGNGADTPGVPNGNTGGPNEPGAVEATPKPSKSPKPSPSPPESRGPNASGDEASASEPSGDDEDEP